MHVVPRPPASSFLPKLLLLLSHLILILPFLFALSAFSSPSFLQLIFSLRPSPYSPTSLLYLLYLSPPPFILLFFPSPFPLRSLLLLLSSSLQLIFSLLPLPLFLLPAFLFSLLLIPPFSSSSFSSLFSLLLLYLFYLFYLLLL